MSKGKRTPPTGVSSPVPALPVAVPASPADIALQRDVLWADAVLSAVRDMPCAPPLPSPPATPDDLRAWLVTLLDAARFQCLCRVDAISQNWTRVHPTGIEGAKRIRREIVSLGERR